MSSLSIQSRNLNQIVKSRVRLIKFTPLQRSEVHRNIAEGIHGISMHTTTSLPSVTRLAYTEHETRALEYLERKAHELNLRTSYDQMGNLHCLIEGQESGLPRVMIGSHIDSVYNGGKFDGVAGLISGLEVQRILQTSELTPQRTVELIAFRGEESSRFGKALLGSSLYFGDITLDQAKELHNERPDDGAYLINSLLKLNSSYVPDGNPVLDPSAMLAYLELHIEQSRVLFQRNIPLGLVSVIAAPIRYKIDIIGEGAHSGTTAMRERRDPIAAAGMFAQMVFNYARRASSRGRSPVATVGDIHSFDGSMNQVAEKVRLQLDIRGINETRRAALDRKIYKGRLEIERKTGTEFKYPKSLPSPIYRTSPEILNLFRRIAKRTRIKYLTVPSYAGHDASAFAKHGVPIGMLFVPSREGKSHNPQEFSEIADITNATEVLLNAVIHLARN